MSKEAYWLGILLLFIVVLLPRVFDLDQFYTADEKRWVSNTLGFTAHVAHGEWDRLLSQPHPGITTQWLGASTIYSPAMAVRKIPLVVGQSFLIILCGYLAARLWGKTAASFLILLLAFNPPLIAHTRVYAMDSLLAIFALLGVLCLLAWAKYRTPQYLIFSSFACAAAILSKLPGIVLVPFSLVFIAWHLYHARQSRAIFPTLILWLIVFLISAALLLPSLAINTKNTINEFVSFFDSGDYQELHQEGPTYYLKSLLFFSTPLQWVSLLILGGLAIRDLHRRQPRVAVTWSPLVWALLFAVLFTIQMSLGLKKGDRYILPVFVIADLLTVVTIVRLLPLKTRIAYVCLLLMLLAGIWQAGHVFRIHPYALAYVNPITKPFFGERRLGWGEGLDLAASYLNELPHAPQLKVAAYYPSEFSQKFVGETVPAHQHDNPSVDYVVLYRAMYERGPAAWETDVLAHYRPQTPVKVIRLNNLDYVWIYATQSDYE